MKVVCFGCDCEFFPQARKTKHEVEDAPPEVKKIEDDAKKVLMGKLRASEMMELAKGYEGEFVKIRPRTAL